MNEIQNQPLQNGGTQTLEELKRNAEAVKDEARQILIEAEAEAVIAEFDNPAELLRAAKKVREAGYDRYECYSPFPIHGMDEAMGLRPSILGYIVFGVGFCGFLFAVWLQWWTNVVDYPLVFSGKPYFSLPTFVPVMFELMVLTSAFAAIIGMFYLNKMPRFFHPMFYSERFCSKATDDGFFIAIFMWDKKFNVREIKAFFEKIGGKNIEVVHRPIEEIEIEHIAQQKMEAVK
ncbi:MAG: DUF3341 domain-containing protein [Chloroherpetonaceae bacterium]|nr:DUF3341 domain-containing protein [Chloroherpetonaceae bacterium]MCS7211057.1 DUF3341 domain-containing protein [Chloroherpetonaceae bacterium]MDW8019455.1 DUF3341 domain-containing protein [Chloroherpetonaceae bacterium]MDW8467159.1 DUF3341 domain-containing protein [Chloroherpetonaceae bacterium]